MATKMTKSTTGARTAGPSKQYLKKGGKYQVGGVKLGPEAKAKTKAMTEPTSNPAFRKFKKPMKQMGGKAVRDTSGMTFPYVSPKGAIYSTGKDYMSGTPSSPTDPRNKDYMSKQDSTTQRKTGYTALTKGEKKKGGMVKKQMGGVSVDPNRPNAAPTKETREQRRANRKEVRKTMKDIKSGKYGPNDSNKSSKFKKGGMVKKQYGGSSTFDTSKPDTSKMKNITGTSENPMSKYKKSGPRTAGGVKLTKLSKKQDGGASDSTFFKRASEGFKKKSPKLYNSEDIKKTLPGVIMKGKVPSKKKGGMTKSKK